MLCRHMSDVLNCFCFNHTYLQTKVPLRNTHASLAANKGTRFRGKRPPATPQAAITFEEELEQLKLKHGHQPKSPAPLPLQSFGAPTKTVAAATANQVLPWLPPAPSQPTAAAKAEDTKPPTETAGKETAATDPTKNDQSPKQDSFAL